MKFHYPKFLKSNPNFVGLSIIDLSLVMLGLIASLVFNLGSLLALGIIFASIGISKLISFKYPRGHFQFYFIKRKVLAWRDSLIKISQGILL
jgi:hypothetical protein